MATEYQITALGRIYLETCRDCGQSFEEDDNLACTNGTCRDCRENK